MRSSAMQPQLRLPHEMAAGSIGADCVRKFRCCCSRARPLPPHSRHSVWHTPQCCPAHPNANPDNPSRKRPQSPIPEKDLPPPPPPSAPSAHPAQCPPLAKMSTGCHLPPPPPPPRETPSPRWTAPPSKPAPAESETRS